MPDGEIVKKMTEGIDNSKTIAVFITRNYIKKCNGEGKKGDDDHCKREFDYACRRLGVKKMVAVVMEEDLRDPSQWSGTVGFNLGEHVYIDLSEDGANWEKVVSDLVVRLRQMTASSV